MGFLKKYPILLTGFALTIVFLILGVTQSRFIDVLDLKYYDLLMRLRGEAGPASPIVLVDIDDSSIERLGRWPWPRSLLADGIKKIERGKPKVIGLNIILSEPAKNDALLELEALKEKFSQDLLYIGGSAGQVYLGEIGDAQARLDYDNQLAEVIRNSGNIVLPVVLKEKRFSSAVASRVDKTLLPHGISTIRHPADAVYPRSDDVILPVKPFLDAAAGIGHINIHVDHDGTARRERPIFECRGVYIPSYAVKLAAQYLDIPNNIISVNLGHSIRLGKKSIPTTRKSEWMVGFKGPRGSFTHYSFVDIINNKVPARLFKNKIVLISPSAVGIMNPLSTPTDSTMPLGELSAQIIWAILNDSMLMEPEWGRSVELLLILIVGCLVTFALPRTKALYSAISFILLVLVILGGSAYFFVEADTWIRVMNPLLLLVLGYIGVISLQYFAIETKKEMVEGESAETNRMLGLSFQSQGMLDMAFDKFKKVPVDEEMKGILYNLALDYERKRQISKAAVVYETIEAHDKNYKDVSDKRKKLKQASETMVYGDGLLGGGSSDDHLISPATTTRPTLGRYEIIKQIGKGAMGTVYLGQDPRINRTTAIKTFRFSDDLDQTEIDDLKLKFFREAESAGTLSHPNIVTIYDAGDEQDLAYIAMEYLEGETLEKYIRPDHLLPMLRVIEMVACIADGLDYAHRKGIVHRDIKPANIMLSGSGEIKVTDFGIARITATSQTQTGIVKGTPYYMSPEQISGKKVDGRSDLFSLGVMLFQLLTGALPFRGDNPAALMHQIMNEPHPDPKSINPRILKPLITIMDRSLTKNRSHRYQEASQMCIHLRELHKNIQTAIARRKAQIAEKETPN